MKITKSQLKQIIKEEIEATLDEKFQMPPQLIKKCEELSMDIAAGTIAQQYGDDPRSASPTQLAMQGEPIAKGERAREEYVKLQCAGVYKQIRNVNEDLY